MYCVPIYNVLCTSSIISLDLKENKLLILYGQDKTDLDILDFTLINFQQDNETKKCKLKKILLLGTISLFSTILSVCVYHQWVASLNT